MQDQNDIYQFMKANNLTDKDEKTFLNDYSNPQKAKELYSFFQANKLTDKDETSFYDTYLKKKEPSQSLVGESPSRSPKEISDLYALADKLKSQKQTPSTQIVNQPFNPQEQQAQVINANVTVPTNLPQGEVRDYEKKVKVDKAIDTSLRNRGISSNSPKYKEEKTKLQEQVNNGDLTEDNGKLIRGEGFGEALANTVVNSVKATKNAFEINSITDPEKLAKYFNDNPSEELTSKPSGLGGAMGELIGGVAKPAALLSLNVVPGLGTSAMTAEAYYTSMAAQKRQLYERGLQEVLPPVEAAKKAMQSSPLAALPDAAMAYAIGKGSGSVGKEVSKAAEDGFLNALKNSAKSVGKFAAGGAASEASRSGIEATQGYKVTPNEVIQKAFEGGSDWAKMDAAFKVLGMAGAAPKYLLSAAKELITTAPKEVVDQHLSEMGEQGDAIKQQLDKYQEARKKVEGLVPEEHMATFAGLTEKRDALEKSKEGKSKALTEPIDKQINEIDDRLATMQKTGNIVEVDDVTGQPTELTKPHEELKKSEREGIVVPKDYGTAEVIESGEGENKTFKPKASFIEKQGGLEINKPIKIEDEGKIYKDKESAQKAADEALSKHYYENDMPEVEKPISTKTKETVSTPVSKEGSGSDWMFKNGERKINIADIEDTRSGDDMSLKEAVDRVKKGQESKSEGLPLVARNKNGKWEVADGYHRIAKSIIEGKNDISASIENSIAIRDALHDGKYEKAIKDGLMTANEAKNIIESADFAGVKLEVPKEIIEQAKNETTSTEVSKPTEAEKPIVEEVSKTIKPTKEGETETKTIKTEENAIPIESTNEMAVRQQAGNGKGMGEQNGESEKTTEQGKGETQTNGNEKAISVEPPIKPPKETTEKAEPLNLKNKSILKRIVESEKINPETKTKFEENLKYEVRSKDEARKVAKELINEYGVDDAVSLAEANKFHGDINSMIFNEALDNVYQKENSAKTPQEKLDYASQWADIAMRYDESARSQGRFISAIGDFYKTSPLGFRIKEEANRNEAFKEWFKGKEKDYKEVFEAIKEEPEFKDIIKKEVQEQLKKERAENRAKTRKKIEDFFDNAKFKKDATYATIIPPNIINGGIEIMKQTFLAGESVVDAVSKAIEHISDKIADWDKEKFRKEWEDKLRSLESKQKKNEVELTEEKKQKILDRFRKKLKGLSDSEKEDVIRKSFKKLVENGALEYEDFKKIIADTIGLGELDEQQKEKISQYVKDINDVQDKSEAARNTRTKASLDAYDRAAKKSEKSATELAQIVYSKPQLINRITSIIQLNTLGIPSLVNNPIFNIVNQSLVRFPKAVQLSALDQIIKYGAKAIGKEYNTQTNVLISQIPFWQGLGKGAKISTEQLFTGLTNRDYFQKEVKAAQIHPFTSQRELWGWARNKKHLSKAQLADKTIQATVGMPAEVVARMLNIGDKPQRFATEHGQAAVIANNFGLKGMDEKLFFAFPKEEAYRIGKKQGLSDTEAMKRAEEIERKIVREGEESTFQEDNVISEMLVNLGKAYDNMAKKDGGNAWLQAMGGLGKLARTINMPFVKIPLNAYWSYFNLVNPEIALAQSAVYGTRAIYRKMKGLDGAASDFEESKKWLTHATTGMAMLAVTGMLAKQGIIKGDNSIKDTKKEREGEKNYQRQHSINLNGLDIDLKWFGVLGNAMNLQANKIEDMTPEQRKNGMTLAEDVLSNLKNTALEQFDNGVFSGTSSLFNAINNGGGFADAWMMNQINMLSNVVHPAMFAQLSRAQLPNEYTTKADTFWEEVKNNASARSTLVRKLTGHYPPSKIGIWGDAVSREPGFENTMLRWFSMSKHNKDNFAQPIYEDYLKTGDTGFFPPSVKPEIDKQKLNTKEATELSVLVGQSRKNLIAPFVNDMATLPGYDEKYSKLSIKDKKDALEQIYSLGYKEGVRKFRLIHPEYPEKEKNYDEEYLKKEQEYKKQGFKKEISNE